MNCCSKKKNTHKNQRQNQIQMVNVNAFTYVSPVSRGPSYLQDTNLMTVDPLEVEAVRQWKRPPNCWFNGNMAFT